MPAFEIHVFSPSMTYESPSGRAAVFIEAMSDPASASEMANAAIASPLEIRGRYRSRSSGDPNREIGPAPSPCIAKEKSASPENDASVSRAMQIDRTSRRSYFPP